MNTKSPASVKVIGWTWIALATLMFFSGGIALLGSILAPAVGGSEEVSAGDFNPVIFVFDHFELFAAGQILFAIGALWSAVSFLRLRGWARPMLEAFAWCLAALAILLTAVFLLALLPPGRASVLAGSFTMYFSAIALSIMAGLPILVPSSALLFFIRRREVRRTFAARGLNADGA